MSNRSASEVLLKERGVTRQIRKIQRSDTCDADTDKKNTVLTFVEFYCGVGGWTMALEAALENTLKNNGNNSGDANDVSLRCVAAVDHSDLCTKVYNHNHTCDNNHINATTMSIEKITLQTVEKWNADIWAMSPPCQPHTRQHDNQNADLDDPRSKSFLHLCHLIETMSNDTILPKLILIENVIGFETSNSCHRIRQALHKRNYSVGHFHLSPPQVNIPNDRPRYYCVAVRLQVDGGGGDTSSVADDAAASLQKYLTLEKTEKNLVNNDVEATPPPLIIHKILEELGVMACCASMSDSINDEDVPRSHRGIIDKRYQQQSSSSLPSIGYFIDKNCSNDLKLRIPEKTLSSNTAWCFDIVTPNSQRSSCFTQAYGRFIRGTGSVLYFGSFNTTTDDTAFNDNNNCGNNNTNDKLTGTGTPFQLVPPEKREFNKDWARGLDLKNCLRYFSGNELAQLFDFKRGFSFPDDCTLKQQWKLLGNSINVRVAARMCELGLRLILSNKKVGMESV